jgi:Delta3-Delta2-enoyl-CoA isomerase
MSSSKPLFAFPISTGGEFTLTCPASSIYLLTFKSPPDNRVTVPYIEAFSLALDIVEHRCPSGSVLITTSGLEKFYSNGFDIADLQTGGTEFMKKVFGLIWRILA